MDNGFWFAGKSTKDFNIKVEHFPMQSAPKRKSTSISVPGRNGDLHYDDGSYQNCKQAYSIGFYDKKRTSATAHAIKSWLLGTASYQRLEDVYNPNHFRMAVFSGPIDIENKLNKIGKCVITFDCAPQFFLKSGEMPVTLTSPGSVYNDYFTSLPIIYVYGEGTGTVTVNGITVELNRLDGNIVLDCETQDAYQEAGGRVQNRNDTISAPEFPSLLHGNNFVSWSGNVESVKLIPRWWEL